MVLGARLVSDELDMLAFTDGVFAAHPDRASLVAVRVAPVSHVLLADSNL